MKTINLRPHHLLCLPRYFRGGYNKKYANNLKKICKTIRKNPNIKIRISKNCDDICKKCPNLKSNACMKTKNLNKLILIQDKRVLKKLNIKNNSIHKARDVFNLSIKKIKTEDLNYLCRIKYDCEYLCLCKKYGMNKSFIKDINK